MSRQDFFYICVGHLKDRKFCQPDTDEAATAAAKRKADLEREIEAVKKEYEEKQKRKKEKRTEKEKAKDKGSKKDAEEEDKQDEKDKDDKVRQRSFCGEPIAECDTRSKSCPNQSRRRKPIKGRASIR